MNAEPRPTLVLTEADLDCLVYYAACLSDLGVEDRYSAHPAIIIRLAAPSWRRRLRRWTERLSAGGKLFARGLGILGRGIEKGGLSEEPLHGTNRHYDAD